MINLNIKLIVATTVALTLSLTSYRSSSATPITFSTNKETTDSFNK